MKKIILLLLLVILSLSFYSCEDSAVSEGRKLYKAYFRHILKDPDSFVVYKEEYAKEGKSTVSWKLDFGAKNLLGGMTRETKEFKTVSNISIRIDDRTHNAKDLK